MHRNPALHGKLRTDADQLLPCSKPREVHLHFAVIAKARHGVLHLRIRSRRAEDKPMTYTMREVAKRAGVSPGIQLGRLL
jgi:hypothetical protein